MPHRVRTVTVMDRRAFLKLTGTAAAATAAAGVLAACGSDTKKTVTTTTTKGATGTTKPTGPPRKVRLGFIALTDAASVIMAKELGYFEARNLDVEILKQVSWPGLRDALLTNQIDVAHSLYSLPFAVATGIGGTGSTDLKVAMILSNNGQGITLAKEFAEVGYGNLKKAGELLNSRQAPELGMTFPGGTHDLWLRYWLKAAGANASNLKISPIPPPQMVQNMSVGNVKGFSVGEPWNAVAAAQGIGFTTLATQDLWLNHPEKALVATGQFASTQEDTLADVMAAVLEASKWLDVPANRSKAADTISRPEYVNAPAADIRGRLTGVYDLGAGLGKKVFKGNQMQFFRGGETNFPRHSYGIWAMAQYVRLGLLPSPPAFTKIADELILTDLYKKVAKREGITVPADDMSPFTVKLDNATFDPNKPLVETRRA